MIAVNKKPGSITFCRLFLFGFISCISYVCSDQQCRGVSVYICNGTHLQQFPDENEASLAIAFEFYENNFTSLHSGVFTSPYIQRIIVDNLKTFSVDTNAFNNVKGSLVQLVLGPITYEFDSLFFPVSNMTKLSYLELWNTRLSSGRILKHRLVKESWLPHLWTLVIPHSGISDIKQKVLPTHINTLILKNNSLTEIPKGVQEIIGPIGIGSLNLDGNKFRKLMKIWFPRKCSLDELSIEYNRLQCIQSDALTSCKYLRKLFLSGNPYLTRIGPYNLNFHNTKSLDLRIKGTGITSLNFLQGFYKKKRPLTVTWKGSKIECDCSMKLYLVYKKSVKNPDITGQCVWKDGRAYPVSSTVLETLWELNGCKEAPLIESTDTCMNLTEKPKSPNEEQNLLFEDNRDSLTWSTPDPLIMTKNDYNATTRATTVSSYTPNIWRTSTLGTPRMPGKLIAGSDPPLSDENLTSSDVKSEKTTKKQPIVIKTYDCGQNLKMSWALQICLFISIIFARRSFN